MALNYKYLAPDVESVIRLTDGFILWPDNPTPADWKEYQDWLAAGNTPEPADDIVYDVTVAVWQLRTVVAREGLMPEVDGAVAKQGDFTDSNPYYSLWTYGQTVKRQSQFATMMKVVAGIDDAKLDDIFERASMLNELPPVI